MRAALRMWILAALLGGCASMSELFLPAPAGVSRPPVVADEEPAPAPSRPAPVAREPAPVPAPSRPATPPATPPPTAQPPAASVPPPATPPAPPRTANIPREPSTPAPVLAPQASVEEELRIKSQAERRIEGTERLVQKIDPARLAREQRENYSTIQSFLAKAREALSARDMQRAFTLADKAYLLADELSKGPR